VDLIRGQPNPLVALIRSRDWSAMMNYLLFGLKILIIVTGIAIVPARSELRIYRSRVIYNGPGKPPMTRDPIDLQQIKKIDLSAEKSDEGLEAVCGGLMGGSPTLAHGSYCLTCRPYLHWG